MGGDDCNAKYHWNACKERLKGHRIRTLKHVLEELEALADSWHGAPPANLEAEGPKLIAYVSPDSLGVGVCQVAQARPGCPSEIFDTGYGLVDHQLLALAGMERQETKEVLQTPFRVREELAGKSSVEKLTSPADRTGLAQAGEMARERPEVDLQRPGTFVGVSIDQAFLELQVLGG